ncbi:MAG: isocitrate dehydrogenase [Clostridiales bacterium]|nr:isocitrate dehydrogenase [Clostridiales bacterium]
MHTITLIQGDGIGPEVTASAKQVIDALKLDIAWDVVNAGLDVYNETGELVPDSVYQSIEKNKVVLKGPITTPIGEGFRSINVMLRKKYDLYCNLRPALSIQGIETRYSDIDIILFRENTEGLYVGVEHVISDDEIHAEKIITRKGSERIIRAAFEYAEKHGRKKVTLVHKANILKLTDGMFLNIGKDISTEYPNILFEAIIIDNMCMQLVMNPNQFDVVVTMNLYGDILSDLCAGLIGGLGVIPGANIGETIAVFEAVHGSAPTIAGKNLANPTAILLSAAMLLDHIGEVKSGEKLRNAITSVLKSGVKTTDLGGDATTTEFTKAVIEALG